MRRHKSGEAMDRLRKLSLKNKIFFSTTAVILLISVLIALFTRWVLISSLNSELQRRGLGIAQSIAESCRGFILTENIPELTSLAFDARLGERRQLVLYVFILNKQNKVLCHTFTDTFPRDLADANALLPEANSSIRLLRLENLSVYDVAVPVIEGIYRIGTVRLGVNKQHIDQLIGKLRTTFVGFVSVVTVIFFAISHWLSKYITRPIWELTKISDEISRGNFDVQNMPGATVRCWQIKGCLENACPADGCSALPCQTPDETGRGADGPCPDDADICRNCGAYPKGGRDEVRQLTESFLNMTRRIQISQKQLRESEEKYRSLFTGGPNPIFVVDRDNLHILSANPAVEETYGYCRRELVGMPFTRLGPVDLQENKWASLKRNAGQRSTMVRAKVQFYKKDNTAFYVNVHASPARYQDRDALIIATTDITEMVEKDNQLIQASKMKTLGEMSAGIAHELNQPLNAIKMGSEFLKMMIQEKRRIADADLFRVVDEMGEQVNRAADIIVRLRDFGRKADFTKDRVNVNRPIQTVLDIVGRQLSLQNINVYAVLDPSDPQILAHHNRIEQVIFNLITNARDAIIQKHERGASPDPKEIRIRSFIDDGHVGVSVSDTGIGVPEHLKDSIFDAFFTTKEMGEGMGLGLSISSGIVEDYGGRIAIDSRQNRGTTFTLIFPRAELPDG